MSQLLARLFRAAAEGRLGKAPKAVYWFLAGKKTWTALVIAGIYAALKAAAGAGVCPDCDEYQEAILGLSAALLAVGLYDGAVRLDPPEIDD